VASIRQAAGLRAAEVSRLATGSWGATLKKSGWRCAGESMRERHKAIISDNFANGNGFRKNLQNDKGPRHAPWAFI
jgi:hypothetical protein